MPKRFFKRYSSQSPSPWLLKTFGQSLTSKQLWHINRRSVSLAVSIGLFFGFLPIPAQMLLAGAVAIRLRCHLVIAISMVWVSNPATMGPLFYGNYILGAVLLDIPVMQLKDATNLEALVEHLPKVWLPLACGSFVAACLVSCLGYIFIRGLWRLMVIKRWRLRRKA